MRTYAEALEHARDGAAFSNGFEWDHWQANWCDRCTHDKEARDGDGPGCPLILVALIDGLTPAEWLEQDGFRLGDNVHCIEFRDEDDPGGAEPTPLPDPPGQEILLPREPYEGVRMLTQPTLTEVTP